MFFILSKTVGFFALPSNALIALTLVGLVLATTRFRRAGLRLAAAGAVLLAIFGYSPLGNMLMLPLEERFPRWDDTRGAPDGIIVLGGAIGPEVSAARGEAALSEGAERLTKTAELARLYPAARIVFTGGTANLVFDGIAEADVALKVFEGLGIARERITLENRSRNTVENAVMTKALVTPKPGERWLIVTSAYHMPRSIGIFRKAGFPVEAYPVDWRTRGPEDVFTPFNVLSAGLARCDTAVREWVGLLAYRLSGQSSALFPSP